MTYPEGSRVFVDRLKPDKEFLDPGGFYWFKYSQEQTGIAVVNVEDPQTNVVLSTVLANPDIRSASLKAWSSARHSRASGTVLDILLEIKDKNVDSDKKVSDFFNNYGHASVAELASGMTVHFQGVPMTFPMGLFNIEETYAAQEKSTRYQQEFRKSILSPLKHYLSGLPEEKMNAITTEYTALGEMALGFFNTHLNNLEPVLTNTFKPENAEEKKSLDNRNLDIARGFLLFGMGTGNSLMTSAREWSAIIARMKGSHLPFFQRMGNHVEKLLAPTVDVEEALGFKAEAPSLLRHTEASTLVNKNLANLRQFLEKKTDLLDEVGVDINYQGRRRQTVCLLPNKLDLGDRMAAQYLLTLWPGLNHQELYSWLAKQSDETKSKIGALIKSGHDYRLELPNWAGTTGLTMDLNTQLKVTRDLNRHRAWERFINLPLMFGDKWDHFTAKQIVSQGFGVSYHLGGTVGLSYCGGEIEKDFNHYYQKLLRFVDRVYDRVGNSVDYTFVANLLPLAHMTGMFMHGDPRQANYLTTLRVRNGGDIDYRLPAYGLSLLVSRSSPYFESWALSNRPDPKDRLQFFDRS